MSRGRARLCVAIALVFTSLSASAYEVHRLATSLEAKRYRIEFEATLDAPPAAVMAVLTRYDDYPRLDPRILSARVEADATGKRLVTLLKGCLSSWLCRELDRVETLRETALVLEADIVPQRSDLRYGRTVTTLRADGAGTRVIYVSEFEFGVFAPAWLVRRPMLRALEDGTRTMFAAVEQRARGGAGS